MKKILLAMAMYGAALAGAKAQSVENMAVEKDGLLHVHQFETYQEATPDFLISAAIMHDMTEMGMELVDVNHGYPQSLTSLLPTGDTLRSDTATAYTAVFQGEAGTGTILFKDGDRNNLLAGHEVERMIVISPVINTIKGEPWRQFYAVIDPNKQCYHLTKLKAGGKNKTRSYSFNN